jgi:uncharacterized protein (DUF1800 family)
MTPDAMPKTANDPNGIQDSSGAAAKNNEEYRRIIRDYYLQNGLQQPQRITAELQASRILRAVYSERQLQEVLVDFWSNHFNVFAGKGADRWLLNLARHDRRIQWASFMICCCDRAEPAMLFYL